MTLLLKSCVIDTAKNRMTQRNGATVTYDFNGNQNNDGGALRWYDGENRLSKADSSNYYCYDAGGSRARRVVNGQETWQVYGFEGRRVHGDKLSGGGKLDEGIWLPQATSGCSVWR